jgi:hypothetical protein
MAEMKSAREAVDDSNDSEEAKAHRRKHRRSAKLTSDQVSSTLAAGESAARSPRHQQRAGDEISSLRKEVEKLRSDIKALQKAVQAKDTGAVAVAGGDGEGQVDPEQVGYWERKTVWGKLGHFFGNGFTGHALPFLVNPNRPISPRGFFWMLIFLAATIGLIVQIIPVIRTFANNETGSVVKRQFQSGVRFPAVTICPQNGLKCTCDAWDESPLFESLECGGDENANLTDRGLAALLAAGWSPTDFFAARNNASDCGTASVGGRNVSAADLKAAIAGNKLDGKDLLIYGGYSVEDLVLSCSYAPQDLDCSDAKYWSPTFVEDKLCWTLNSAAYKVIDAAEDPNFIIDRSGDAGALALLLKHNAPTYPAYVEEVGLTLLLHDQNVSAVANPNTIQISPQVHARVGFTREQFVLLGGRFRPGCKIPAGIYSTEQCIESCWSDIVLKMCDCVIPGFLNNDTAGKRACSVLDNYWCDDFPEFCTGEPAICADPANANAQPCCGYRVQQALLASFNATASVYDDLNHKCNNPARSGCLASCNTLQYALQLSYAAIPNPAVVLADDTESDGALNFADVSYVTIVPSNLNVFVVEQIEATPLEAMLSNVGGTLGLWNGFSLITIVECIEALLLISICSVCQRRRANGKKQSSAA